jgi:outer membrane protein OmpA-like peptidoglycan-associated protein
LQLATGDGTTGATCSTALRNSNYENVPLSSLTALSYSTYDQVNNGSQFPYLRLQINYGGGGTNANDTLFFEPPYQTPSSGSALCPDQGAPVMDTWQNWNALTGCWWSNSGSLGNPGTGVVPMSYILSQYPNAYIVNMSQASSPFTPIARGGIGVEVGEGGDPDQFVGNVDNFTIGTSASTTTYNFEPATPCTATCYVNSTTGNDANDGNTPTSAKQTIQAALNQVSSGGTVIVAAGSYSENDTISNPVTLEGAQYGQAVSGRTSGGSAESILTGANLAGGVPVITVNAPNVTIDGFDITDPETAYAAIGIDLKGAASGTTIQNNIFDGITSLDAGGNGTAQAIYLESGPSNVIISNNKMTNISSSHSAKAVLIGYNGSTYASNTISVVGNVMSNITSTMKGAYGVSVAKVLGSGTTGLKIFNNTISGLSSTSGWVHAIGVEGNAPNIVVSGNTISGLTVGAGVPIAVWIESEDTSYGTATVTGNSLDVGAASGGLLVDPALTTTGTGTVLATCNWWGNADGPSGAAGAPGGTGSQVTVGVGFSPWLTTSSLSSPSCTGQLPLGLSFGPAPSGVLFGNTGVSVLATTTPASIGTVVYSTSSSACTVNSSTGAVTVTNAGSCVIDANDTGNAAYAAASQAQVSFNIGRSTVLGLTFGAAPSGVLYGATGVSVNATSSPSSIGTVVYSTTSTACSVDPSTGAITTLGVGSCDIFANDSGTSNYVAAFPVDQTFSIGQSTSLSLSFVSPPTSMQYGATGVSVNATISPPSTGTVVSYSTTSTACSVNSSTGAITTLGVGQCVIEASDPGNANYVTATPQSTTVQINKSTALAINFGSAPSGVTLGEAGVSVSATLSPPSTGTVVSYSTTSAACTVNSSTGAITTVQVGSCVIDANDPGNADYVAAPQVTTSFTVNPTPAPSGGGGGSAPSNDTVAFNSEGGSAEATLTVPNGTSTALPTPTLAGFKFVGWFTAATGGTLVTSPLLVSTPTTTLFAQWTIVTAPAAPARTYQEIFAIHTFAPGSATLTKAIKAQISNLVSIFAARNYVDVILTGNAVLPHSTVNQKLARARALAVDAYMRLLAVKVHLIIQSRVSGTTLAFAVVYVQAK